MVDKSVVTRPVQLHLAQFLSSLNCHRMLGVNKTSSCVRKVETACPLKHGQWSMIQRPTHPRHRLLCGSYLNIAYCIIVWTPGLGMSGFCMCKILHRVGQRAQNWLSCVEWTKRHRNCKILQILFSSIALALALMAATASVLVWQTGSYSSTTDNFKVEKLAWKSAQNWCRIL